MNNNNNTNETTNTTTIFLGCDSIEIKLVVVKNKQKPV